MRNGISIQINLIAFADNKVTASYGSATAKKHADTTWTQEQIDDGDGYQMALIQIQLLVEGLKT